jgi:cytochrome P450
VTTNNFEDYEKDDWAQVIAKYMGNGVLVNDGAAWHVSRSMLKPLFKRNRSSDFQMFSEHADRLIELLETNIGRFVDFRRAIQQLVLDITTDILCTEPTKSLSNALAERRAVATPNESEGIVLDLIDGIEPYGSIAIELGLLSLFVFIWQYRRIMQLVQGLQTFFETAVHAAIRVEKEKEQTANQNESIIVQMLRQGITTADAQGELQNIFFAAFDTTTALLTNLFDCLARHPEVQSQLRDDIATSIGETIAMTSAIDISRSIYLRATIMETLRLCSPISYHTRKARVDTILPQSTGASLHVPKGTSVVWSTYTLNRQQEVCGGQDWADFRPERWIEIHPATGARQLITRQGFMPFGSGPRNCLGQQFAQSLTAYITARIVLAFDGIEHQHRSSAFQEAIAVTYYNKQGTNIRFSGGST